VGLLLDVDTYVEILRSKIVLA